MKTNILITVDVETWKHEGRLLPFETNVLGLTGGREYGVQKIMDVCDAHGAKATFFVDALEHRAVGEKPLSELCRRIESAGHGAQLHVHPNWIPGNEQGLLSAYPYEAQRAAIAEGAMMMEKWTGRKPAAFRAGAYGASLDTLRALRDSGIGLDSSYFLGNRNCVLWRELGGKTANASFSAEGVTEIPVTVYGMALPNRKSKIDINACSLQELKHAVDRIMEFNAKSRAGLRNIVIFLHSFSFVKWNPSYVAAGPDGKTLEKFVQFIGYIRDNYGNAAAFRKLEECGRPEAEEDFLPRLGFGDFISRMAGRIWC